MPTATRNPAERPARSSAPTAAPRPRRVGVALSPAMSLSSLLLAVEPLRSVNRFFQRPAYEIVFVGPSADPVASGIGIAVTPAATFGDGAIFDLALAVSAYDQPEPYRRALARWLRRQARAGATLCGVDYGAVFLAEAGLLDGRRATTHWEVRKSVAARFPRVAFRDEIFVIDGPRLTCGGHLACHDLFLTLVEREHGAAVARFVEADLIAGRARPAETRQGDPLTTGPLIPNAHLRRAVAIMEANVETPLPLPALAAQVGISARQLQTLSRRHLGETVSARYLSIRLSAARYLLMYADMPVTEVALATGFGSASSFSRAFRTRLRTSPRAYKRGFAVTLARPWFFPPG